MRYFTLLSIKILIILAFICSLDFSEGLGAEQQKGNKKILTPGLYPEIQFDEVSHNFGKIFQNETLEHIFYFRNIGTGNLHILKVKGS